ncbi:bifunctional hydroxymethylpyrimidine kinase/phosphomethylpyrimidine kinase [bacterium]|nr:bifunctional hydroxymethylpyrimidine kinase/phosphomethylpyrimidine kinase [bacterium]
MSLLVVGSVALDSIETPSAKVENVLGGSATYFSVAASFFQTQIQLVAIVGDDFPKEYEDILTSRGVNLSGLEHAKGKTFHWKGRYNDDLSVAETITTELNVYEKFQPTLSESHRNAQYIFLANIHPELQLSVIQQTRSPKLIACDTMNLWIDTTRKALLRTLKDVDILILNDAEAKSLSGEINGRTRLLPNLKEAARVISDCGPKQVVVKKGKHGVDFFSDSTSFSVSAYLLKNVVDTTGAGDSFAGGFMGYLAEVDDLSLENIRKAIIYGSVLASFNIESFSINRMRTLTREEIDCRFEELQSLTK